MSPAGIFIPDFQRYSDTEIREVVGSINRDKFPQIWEALQAEIKRRNLDIIPKVSAKPKVSWRVIFKEYLTSKGTLTRKQYLRLLLALIIPMVGWEILFERDPIAVQNLAMLLPFLSQYNLAMKRMRDIRGNDKNLWPAPLWIIVCYLGALHMQYQKTKYLGFFQLPLMAGLFFAVTIAAYTLGAYLLFAKGAAEKTS